MGAVCPDVCPRPSVICPSLYPEITISDIITSLRFIEVMGGAVAIRVA